MDPETLTRPGHSLPGTRGLLNGGVVLLAILLANTTEFIHIPWKITVLTALLVLSIAGQSFAVLQFVLLLILFPVYFWIVPASMSDLPAVGFLIPFFLLGAISLPIRGFRAAFPWLRPGKIDRVTAALVVITGIFSTVALILWAHWTNHIGIALKMAREFGSVPLVLAAGLLVPAFALINAFAEEVIYRGVVQEAAEEGLGKRSFVPLLLQGSAFAAVHYASGFPNGIVGYLMVLVYGTMLGYLRRRSQGILAPYLAHVIADLTIGYILLILVWHSR